MKKTVFKLDLHDDKAKRKAMKTVSSLSGVDSMSMDMKEKKLTVIGDADPVHILSKLRKLCNTEIITVGPAKEPEKKKDEPKKEESKKKDQDPVAAPFIDPWGRFFFSDIFSAADARATDQGKGEKMDHSNVDSFWNHVVKMDDGSMKCKFCGCPFAKGTSILRIKWHLSGERGPGVTICTGQVPKDVQEVAFLAVPGNKRQKTIAISSNVNDNAISSCPQVENNEVDNLARDVGMIRMAAVQDREQGVGEGRTSSRAEAGNLMEKMAGEMMHIDRSITAEELIVDAHENRGEGTSSSGGRPRKKNEIKEDALPTSKLVGQASKGYKHKIFDWVVSKVVSSIGIIGMSRLGKTTWVKHQNRGEALQAPDLLGQAFGSSGNEIRTFLMKDDVENSTGGVAQPGAGTSSSGGLPRNTNKIKGDALSTTKLVGQAFEDHKKMIRSWLMNDEVSSIGIYGMGGVGKTTLVKNIYDQLLERPDNHVYWITVSQVFSINKLQSSIARLIGLDLSNEEEEMNRAVKLSKELMKIQNWVLILDDLWNSFKPHKVGIPVPMKGCKLIVTTRSVNVCQGMNSQKEIEVKPLSQEEAWTLFMEKFGCDVSLFGDVKKIAQLIAEECDGLPLVIVTMAGTMKGVDDIHEWRNALEYLKQSRVRQDDMEPKVSRILRFSYTHLKDSSLQQCFLYCSLFPEDFEVDRNDLIGYLIDEGVIKETNGRWAEFDKGHGMLNELLNVSLLERGRNSGHESVKMHDLIRDMALQIQQENSQVMVKAGVQLKELPIAEEWTKNLVRVSLMENQIEEIPSRHSPRCPSLSTLLLCNNELQFIANSFFKEMHRLMVLDLSHTNIEILPDFVSNLVSLNALLLKSCEKLRHIPSLQKLTTLKRLDLSKSTALESMPQGMECLSNLKYLRLNGCGEKEFPSGILPKLLNLQVLVLENNMPRGYAPVTVKGDEVACLTKLETLECYFEGYSDFMEYLKLREKSQSLSRYQIFVGQLDKFCRNKSVGLGNLSISRDVDFQLMFPNDIEELVINNCNDARSLCDVSPLIKYPTELEVIRIWYCNSLESLVSSSWFCSAPLPLPSSNGIFSSLREFYCYKCTSMKKLFPLILLPNLVNLERISVVHCEKMEEIIATRDEEGVICEESSSCYSNSEVNLPKLRILELRYLPELKSICSAKLICNSLEEIEVWDCEKLERMSVALPLLDNGQPSPPPYLRRISVYPNKWWETVVEWEHPNTKEILSRLLSFGRTRHCP